MRTKKITWILLSFLVLSSVLSPPSAAQSFAKEPDGQKAQLFLHPVLACLSVTPSEPVISPPATEKKTQTIQAADLSTEMGASPFFLQATTNGGTLSFRSKNTKVANIHTSTGKVTLVGAGTTKITIQASATDEYKKASKTITLTVKKGNAKLKAAKNSYTKPYKSKAFSLGASARCPMKFKSSNTNVAKVNSKGKVTVLKCGEAAITITAGSKDYKTAKKKVSIRVVPKTAAVISAKSASPGQLTVSWKRQGEADGYVIEYTTDPNFKKNVEKQAVSKNKTVSITLEHLQEGKKYYVRVKAY